MRFQWDEEKNARNIRKHGFDFADAWEVFQNALISRIDSREDYGEDRWHGIGVLQGRTVVVVFAERDPDIVRIISLRKANKNEKKQYEKAIKNRLDSHRRNEGR